jgi:acyl-CoA dehydrogenase
MSSRSHLDWPFFDGRHRKFCEQLSLWAERDLGQHIDHRDVDASCRALVRALGAAGWLRAVVPRAYGGLSDDLDVRTLCIARQTLAWHDGLADFAFAMQGLGSASIALFGTPRTRSKYLPAVAEGRHIAAFALSEPEAGSDVAALATTVTQDGPTHVRIDGTKTWISNGGIADHYVVFARTEGTGTKGLSCYVVDSDTSGLEIADRIDVIAPHPLATLRFDGCRVPVENRIGGPGEGFKVAMATLDVFRPTVAAAALGLAQRALDEMVRRASGRQLFGQVLADFQLTQAAMADSAIDIEAAALLVYQAAWKKDHGAPRITREASMAKAFATEMAQRVIDRAVQISGGNGVRVGSKVEALYREIRAMRIYEGATEIQKLIVARDLMRTHAVARQQAAEQQMARRSNNPQVLQCS